MDGRERVKRAIGFEHPDRVPIAFFNRDFEEGDILMHYFGLGEEDGRSEWGYRWESLDDGTMGQPDAPVIPAWDDYKNFRIPALKAADRLKGLEEFKRKSERHYRLATFGISGFTTYTFLRGFENALMDFLIERDKAIELLDGVFSFEKDLITLAAENGFDGVHFSDDWGTQDGLIVSPEIWRSVFKPRYQDQFDHARKLGVHTWFHCCGNIKDIVPDFHEIGLDVLNISQPNVVDTRKVGEKLRGEQCFMIPISYQTVSISGTPQEIHNEARRLFEELGCAAGGFIGYVEDYKCMGMTEVNYQACVSAFRALK